MKITPTSLTLNQLFSSANEQFVIPAYQRRYSWRERQLYELIEDIELLENSDVHLLGSIVCLTGHHTAGINRLELVDGQQRLTTICILLECLRERLIAGDEADQAQALGRLLTAKASGGKAMPKIALDSIDGDEYRQLVDNANGDDHSQYQNQHLVAAFAIIRQWIEDQDLTLLGGFLYKLQNQALIIRLDVNDAKDAFKLFETINNRGLKLSPTDIIKNFVLGNAARFDADQLEEARKSWALLIAHLDGTDTDAFFRYFLISATQRRITKSQVVPEFKTLFMNEVVEAEGLSDRHLYADEEEADDDEPDEGSDVEDVPIEREGSPQVTFKEFLRRVVTSAEAFGELVLIRTGRKRIDRHLRNLRMIKSAQTYGFLMHLRVGGVDDKTFIEVLKLTENFVLRRHVCRERANETESLFAKLCAANPERPLLEVKAAYREACPTDEKFRHEFANANFTSNIIDRARYCLEQIELRRHGSHAELQILGSDDVHVEHIIPRKIKTRRAKEEFGDWVNYLGDRVDLLHPRMVSRIGNLTLFAGALNIGASNNPFASKKKAYRESAIMITQDLAGMSAFKFKQVEARSSELADLAVSRWPIP
ncbi:DUF262 domain-containing HNH endonuclease family protein [Mesorhizobium sp. M0078]|uniref:DUF262 domain-containing protein n=1 Tax=Mesorhizobium sp. M0078 TaxID=2956871 RepID=UPI003337CD3E